MNTQQKIEQILSPAIKNGQIALALLDHYCDFVASQTGKEPSQIREEIIQASKKYAVITEHLPSHLPPEIS